jgi:glycosyltransferase involved in cell wall biosynthesis
MLSEALESVMVQSPAPSEVVVSDDANDHETAQVVASFASRAKFFVRYVKCPRSGSQAVNANCALERASSDLILLLHDDDLLYPEALGTLRQPFLEVQGLIASYGLQRWISNSGQELESQEANRAFFRTEEEAGLKTDSLRSAILGQFPNDGFMVRSSVAKAVLYDPAYGGAVDAEFGVRCAAYGPFYFVPRWTSKYRLSAHSIARGPGRKSGDTSYHFVRLCLELLDSGAPAKQAVELRLRERVRAGIVQAAAVGDTDTAFAWLLGPYHRRQLLSLPGVKRALIVMLASLRSRVGSLSNSSNPKGALNGR